MQRTTAGFYQSVTNRSEEYLTVGQTVSSTPRGTLSQQLHWKKKAVNKTVASKRRQNPSRQAAVRSFKKYQFSNQDFLLRKYLRSVKKELRPKPSELPVETDSNAINLSGNCRIPRQPVDKTALRRVSGVPELRQKMASSNSTVISSTSSINNKKITYNQENDVLSKMNQEFNLDEEITKCLRKNWPTRGFERPSFHNVEIESAPTLLIGDELKKMLNESGVLISQYCKSLRDLSDIMNYNDYNCPNDDHLLSNNFALHGVIKRNDSEIENRFHHCTKSVSNIDDLNNEDDCMVDYPNDRSNDQISFHEAINDRNNNLSQARKVDCEQMNGCNMTDDEHDNNEDDDDDDDDNDDDDNDDDDDDEDDEEDDDDYDYGENSVDSDEEDCNERRVNNSLVCRQGGSVMGNKESNNNNQTQCVVSIDTSDSSSVSSSLDNTSLSTVTCSDNQTINSDNQDQCDFKKKNNNSSSLCNEPEMKRKLNSTYDAKTPQNYVQIKNENSATPVLDKHLSVNQCLKETRSNNLGEEEDVKSVQSLKPSLINNVTEKESVRSKGCDEKLQSKASHLDASNSIDDRQKQQRYIKIRNREYPKSIIDNNPTLIEYLKETHPNTYIEEIEKSKNVQPLILNHSENKTTAKISMSDQKMKPVQIVGRENLSADQPAKRRESSDETKIDETKAQKKRLRKKNYIKDENDEKHEILTVCSVEDGLAFLDEQNVIPSTTNTHHLSRGTSQRTETITLYNHSTSCTLPYPTDTSESASKNAENKKPMRHHQVMNSDQVVPSHYPINRADFQCNKASQSVLPYENNIFQCSKCKLADQNLKESLKMSFLHLNDLVSGSIVLNSLITGESMSDSTSNFFSDLN